MPLPTRARMYRYFQRIHVGSESGEPFGYFRGRSAYFDNGQFTVLLRRRRNPRLRRTVSTCYSRPSNNRARRSTKLRRLRSHRTYGCIRALCWRRWESLRPMSKKKDRAWFVCPQWAELVSRHYASDIEAGRALKADPKVLSRLRSGTPVAKSTVLKMLRDYAGRHGLRSATVDLVVDTRTR